MTEVLRVELNFELIKSKHFRPGIICKECLTPTNHPDNEMSPIVRVLAEPGFVEQFL